MNELTLFLIAPNGKKHAFCRFLIIEFNCLVKMIF